MDFGDNVIIKDVLFIKNLLDIKTSKKKLWCIKIARKNIL